MTCSERSWAMISGQNVLGKPFADWIFDGDTAALPKTALEVRFLHVPGP